MRRRSSATPRLATILAALSFPASATAQEPLRALPETVITATGVPTDPARVAAGITVIDRRTIEERGYGTLADALSAVPGLRIVQAGGAGQAATVFVRGTNSNHVLVLRDGVPVNEPSTPNGLFNFGDDLLDDVERIEIVRGPMAGLYGSSAIGGVINIITRRGAGRFNGAALAEAGTQSTVRGSAYAGGRAGAFDGMLAGGSVSTRGSNVIPPRIATSRGEADGQTAQAVTANAGAWLNDQTRIGLIGRWRQNGFGYDNVGSAFSTVVDDPNARAETTIGSLHATASTLIAGSWRSTLSAARISEDRTFRNLPDGLDPTGQTDDNRYQGWRTDLQWTNAVSLPAMAGITAGAATFGLQYTRDEAEVRVRSGNVFGPFDQDVDARTSTTGGYVGLQGTILDRFDIAGSIRHDAPEEFENTTTWRLGGVWRLPVSVPLRASAAYGTGFRTPTLFDRFGTDGFGFRGNPALRPEKSEGWEAGLAADLEAGPLGAVTIAATYFNTEISDLISTQFSPVYTQVNVGRADIEGVETSLTMTPSATTSLTLSYTYTEAKDARTGLQLPRRPRNTAAATLRWAPVPAVVITPELLLFGPSVENAFAAYDDSGNAIAQRSENPGGVLLNLAARWRVTEGWEAFAIGRNLTNSRYEPANGFASPGRGVFAGLTARW
jgi:vitamin B12 transporter